MRTVGVTSRGIITPIFKEGDDLVGMICDSLIGASKNEGFAIEPNDVIGVTEAVIARTQGNYATCSQMAADISAKFGGEDMGIIFPILSRNRFAIMLKGIAQSCKKLYIQLAYPADEVGNGLVSLDQLDEKNINPYTDSFNEKSFREAFGATTHPFTGVDYVDYYKSFGEHIEIIFSNDPKHILNYTKNVLNCDIHSRSRTKRILKAAGAQRVFSLDEILTQSVDGSGYNPQFGLLGSNKATEDKVKLFPRDAEAFVLALQEEIKKRTGVTIEVLAYGDGCFKDPVGGIWELADPVVSPAYTKGLEGTPNELKLKYFADNELAGLTGDALNRAMRERIREKEGSLVGNMTAEGTTPRRLTDLLGSLCDLTSGSGDRGTPVVYIKGYFTNFASE